MTTTTYTDDSYYALRDAMARFFGTTPYQLSALLPDVSASAEEISELEIFKNISGRDAYLSWVREYKILIHQAADMSRMLKAERRSQAENIQISAQERLHVIKFATTLAIHLRRLGKIWSSSQVRAQRDKAA